jgi:hypothetical protein
MPTGDWLSRLVRHWPAMERIITMRGGGPWFSAVNDGGLNEIPLP